ncbi:DNA-formamidopyrimidine glycosylase family protein [Microbacterium gorillae]|uniref:DNA-formamidopyrimidine glycosylase family protein n=1 Tax=Microbacterium gorillae TaxID=1231063 RepID=UPI0005909C64|nr:DNA-formamidopyrimidine glycosylase family protein [Microbacterium gorillae]
MPEGDTVYRAAHALNLVLAGRELTEFDLRVPQAATVDLRGEVVHEVVPRGKHFLHRIGEHTLHSHLKMEGYWHIYDRGARWRRPAFQARAVVGTLQKQTVGFDLADIAVVRTRDEDSLVGHLGPDPLADDWDPVEAARRLGADTRDIHVALLDQRNIAGFGNEYACEMLFVRGVAPRTPAPEVDVAALIEVGVRMIRMNVQRPGPRVFTGDARPGRTDWVHGRDGKACRRCGTLIRLDHLGADPTKLRQVWWCPNCQR